MGKATMTAEEFFRMVDETLTPAMSALGYHRIGSSKNDQPMSRATLTTSSGLRGRFRGRRAADNAPFLRYDFGFEASTVEVQRLVNPEHPDHAEELWLSYEPSTGELDTGEWAPLAEGHLDWNPRSDTGPCGEQEVRRRLTAMGMAVAEFNPAQDGRPPRP